MVEDDASNEQGGGAETNRATRSHANTPPSDGDNIDRRAWLRFGVNSALVATIGGGLAGCHAKQQARVVGPDQPGDPAVVRSGSGDGAANVSAGGADASGADASGAAATGAGGTLQRAGTAATGAAASPTAASCGADATAVGLLPAAELEEKTFAELQQRLDSRSETARTLVAKYRSRIDAVNERGPMLRAVLELNPAADEIARQLDSERAAGRVRGPLHGLPILLKDNLDTGDEMTTTAGSLALAGTRASKDSFVAARLRDAGAVLFGKTNLSEWANIRGAPSVSGWSARGGQCRNPYALDRSPSGSSSGSAVAVTANLCAAAIGTETDGSIVSPASCNGVVGLKPTIGLVSRGGIVPIAASQDTAGPMTRTVADAAALLTVIAGPDPADPTTTAPHLLRPKAREDYSKYLDAHALAHARIGVPRKGWFGVNRYMDDIADRALATLRELGAVLVDPVELGNGSDLWPHELTVLLTELKTQLATYLGARDAGTKVRTLADVMAFNREHAANELQIFGQELFEQAQATGGLTAKAYRDARATCVRLAREQGIDRTMKRNGLDAIFAVTGGPAWFIDPVNGDASGPTCATLPAVAGYPHITVPAGATRGLPMAISFFGRPFSEGKLLGYAYAFEQATRARRPPHYLPSALGA